MWPRVGDAGARHVAGRAIGGEVESSAEHRSAVVAPSVRDAELPDIIPERPSAAWSAIAACPIAAASFDGLQTVHGSDDSRPAAPT